jgi:hypothetical protein
VFLSLDLLVCKYAALAARLLLIFPIYQLPKKGFLLIGIDLYSDLEGMLKLTVF